MSRRPAFFYWAIAFGGALAVCYAVTGVELWRHARDGKDYGFGGQFRNGEIVVTAVKAGGVAGGTLRTGDVLRKVNGFHGPAWLLNHLLLLLPADRGYSLNVERQGRRLDLQMRIAKVQASGPLYWGFPLQFAASLACCGAGLLMGFSKPGDRTVQFACFSFLALAAFHLYRILSAMVWSLDNQARLVLVLLSLADPLPAATGFLFAARFPKRLPLPPWWRAISVVVCLAVAAEWLLRLPSRLFLALSPAAAVAASHWLALPLSWASQAPHAIWKTANVLIFAAMAAILFRNYRVVQEPDLRRRIRWITLGIVLAIAPLTLLYGTASAYMLAGQSSLPWLGPGEEFASAFVGLVLAGTFGYGVLRHRVLDIHLAIRASIQYLLAKRVLQAGLSLPVVLIVFRVLWNPRITVRDLLFGSYVSLSLMAVAALGLAYRRSLLLAVDRRFFREAYSQEEILRSLIEEIRNHDSIGEISRLVAGKVEAALHPRRILVYYRNHSRGGFSLGHSSAGVEGDLRLSADNEALRLLEQSPRPRDFPLVPSHHPDAAAMQLFADLGVCLLAPITGGDSRLVGILMLGEKLSESPYTASDPDLLQAIAGQIGMVCDNIALRESARREAHIKRSVLAHLDGTAINLLKECPRCGACYDRTAELCSTDGATLQLTLPVDRLIDGVYRLERRIGTGAMGAVYRATDLRLDRVVALKLMTGSLFGNPSAVRRFEREARAAARLSHPNIVAIHDFGAAGSDGAYLVMEFIEGLTMRQELRLTGSLPPPRAATHFHQLFAGLEAAHAAGVVHRDLKPENIILTRPAGGGDLLKILDFGLAKLTSPKVGESASLTWAGAVVGTLGYMSPEQLLGEEVDERSDTFASAVLLVETLTGRRPFSGRSFQELLNSTLHATYRLPGEGPETRRLNLILDRCLAKQRQDRPRIAEIHAACVAAIAAFPPVPPATNISPEESTIDATRL